MSSADALQRAWTGRGLLAFALWPLSMLFGALTSLRRTLYRLGLLKSIQAARPVIIVGNLMVGGAGKTPLVIALIEALRQEGYTPGVISRGYGGSASNATTPTLARLEDGLDGEPSDNNAAQHYGDEVTLILQRTGAPIALGRDRAAAAEALLRAAPQVDVILSDDGLQHYRLARAFEIAVFDARGPGNGWLLPAGPLREPLRRLRQVDAIVLNGDSVQGGNWLQGRPAFRMRIQAGTVFRLKRRSETRALGAFRNSRVLAVAGIGQPQRFFDTLSAAGLQFETLALPDHFDFRDTSFATHPAEVILMTEKDAVKCHHLDDSRLWVVPVDARIEPGLVKSILEKLRGSAPA